MKLSREDWLAQGLTALADHGPEALKIDRLCAHLGVTKGSFYHYFTGRQSYLDAMLAYWEQHFTDDIIDAVADIADPGARGERLNHHIRALPDRRPEVALRAWSQQEPNIAAVVARVDQRRVAFLTELIAAQLPAPGQAGLLAKLVYAHFVGCQYLGSMVDDGEWERMDQLLRTMVLQYAETGSQGDRS